MNDRRKKYLEENREKIRIQARKYRDANKELLKLREQEYRQANKEKIAKRVHEYGKKRYEQKKDIILEKNKIYYQNNREQILSLNKEYSKEYNKRNKEIISEKHKIWAAINKEKRKIYLKAYREKNKDKLKESLKNRIKSDVLFKLSRRLRSSLNSVFKRKGYSKTAKTFQILGCDFDTLKTHIESQFEPWMTWENKGNPEDGIFEPNKTWDIDHIVPLTNAMCEEDMIKLNHYTNLRPTCSYYNRWIKKNRGI